MSVLKNSANDYEAMVDDCAKQGMALSRIMASRGIMPSLYLYYRESTETSNGKLMLVNGVGTVPEGVKLATGESLNCGVPYDKYHAWVWKRARNVPIMAYGK